MTNYLEDTKTWLVAMQDEIHVALNLTPSAQKYGKFSRDAYPFWRNITGDVQISGTDDGSKLRTHTIYMVWTIGAVSTGDEGYLEEQADSWIVFALDHFQARPTLYSAAHPRPPRWFYGEAYISTATGVIYGTPAQGGKQTASITFTLIAPFRVRAERT